MFDNDDLILAAPDPRLRVSVIIPARDEAAYLPSTLQSLLGQRDSRGRLLDPRTFEVIVLANNCTDDTAQIARKFASEVTSQATIHVVSRDFARSEAHVGTARKWLMDLACRRLEEVECAAGLIASTDADTRVAPGWIHASLQELAEGADAIAGLIQVNREELRQLGSRVRRAYWLDQVHRRLKLELEALIDPNPLDRYPRHDDHGGASLAITPQMYRRVGGLSARVSHEDVALAEALWRADARFIHSRRVRVVTSSRTIGRATNGQSQALVRWETTEEDQVLEVDFVEFELRFRRQLRRLFRAKRLPSATWESESTSLSHLSEIANMEKRVLRELIEDSQTFGSLLERFPMVCERTLAAGRSRGIPISEAIGELRRRIRGNQVDETKPASPKDPSDIAD